MLTHANGLRLAYDLLGPEAGPVVAFSHSLAADLGLWAEQVPPLLAAGYRVLRMDLRGHGGSEGPPGAYTIDGLADDLVALLDRLRIDRCHFVGLSIGGMVGQSLGLRHAVRRSTIAMPRVRPRLTPLLRWWPAARGSCPDTRPQAPPTRRGTRRARCRPCQRSRARGSSRRLPQKAAPSRAGGGSRAAHACLVASCARGVRRT